MVQLDETTLVNRCQAGDIEAFSELVERNNKKAIHTAYLITGCRDIAEDIAQEAFIQCFHSIRKLRDTTLFKSWFYKILVRTSWRMVSNAKKCRLSTVQLKEMIFRTTMTLQKTLKKSMPVKLYTGL